jgi:hypothetical protein
MASIINGSSPTVTFSDGTTQATSAIVSGYVPYANLPAGSVLQVVNYNGDGYATTSSSTWSDVPNLSLAITPKFSTSKILIFATVIVGKNYNTYTGLRLVRNSTTISTFSDISGWTNSSVETTSPTSYNYLDSPSTTSSITYKIQYNSGQNIALGVVGNYINTLANSRHSITIMEIAA